MDRFARRYWDQLALRWRISVPLAPAPEDIDWFERRASAARRSSLRALILGVTASIATMRWPPETSLVAADWSVNMLRNVWPDQGTPPGARVVCADWRELPFGDSSIELVVGDGCFTALGSEQAGREFTAELRRILVPGGTVLMRCFCRPEPDIEPTQLFDLLYAGRLRNLDLFRWLLAVATHGESPAGVQLGDVWQLWNQHVGNPQFLRARLGWTDDVFANVERMKGSSMTYWFPTLAQIRTLVGPAMEVVEVESPGYEWGAVFPRLRLRAR